MAKRKRKYTEAKEGTRAGNGCGYLVKHGGVYHARWYANGKRVSRSTGTDNLEDARDFLARMSVARRGQNDRAVVQKLTQLMSASLSDVDTRLQTIGLPVRDLFRLYSDAPNRRPVGARTLAVYGGQLRELDKWLNRRHPEITSARDISQTIADEYIADRAKTKSPNTVNKDLNLFAAVWRTLARKYGLEYNPWSEEHIARKRLSPTSRRALTPAEVKALLDNSTGEIHLMVLLGISTGLRMGDILNLTWDQIDLKRRLLTIHRTRKTGAPVCLPILPDLRKALIAQPRSKAVKWVLPEQHARVDRAGGNPAAVCQTIQWLFKRCGIETQQKAASGRQAPLATFHSLRHTFVTRLITRGVNTAIVREAVAAQVCVRSDSLIAAIENLRETLVRFSPIKEAVR